LQTQLNDNTAVLAGSWDSEKDDKLLWHMAYGAVEERRLAFDAFYRRHQEYLYGICYDLVNRYKFGFFDQDDVFQSTMIKARDHAGTFKPDGLVDAQELEDKADAWLGGIAKNVVIDLLRRKPKCVSFDPQLLGRDDGDDVDGGNGGSDDDSEICIQVDKPATGSETEEAKLLREAIDTLSPNQQAVIWAASQFYECRGQQRTPVDELDQIVAGLGMSRDNFRKVKQRARKKILEYMNKRTITPEAK